jgi:hypothetical protein
MCIPGAATATVAAMAGRTDSCVLGFRWDLWGWRFRGPGAMADAAAARHRVPVLSLTALGFLAFAPVRSGRRRASRTTSLVIWQGPGGHAAGEVRLAARREPGLPRRAARD